uniref:Uncharacterized protein n=1 Tax=Arundo donax TaxID=35708 RepID=A0A0A8YU39_ARUDO
MVLHGPASFLCHVGPGLIGPCLTGPGRAVHVALIICVMSMLNQPVCTCRKLYTSHKNS